MQPATPREFSQIFSDAQLIHLCPDKVGDGLAFRQIFPPDGISMIVEGACNRRRVGKTVGGILCEHMVRSTEPLCQVATNSLRAMATIAFERPRWG
jgi:hypothetical protein